MTKFCHGCQTEKPKVAWHKNPTTKDGLSSQCAECVKKRTREWVAKNKDRVKAAAKARYARTSDAQKARAKAWHHTNKERARAKAAAYRAANSEKIKTEKRRQTTGFSVADFDEAMRRQKGACAICGIDLTRLPPRQVHADHCHVTGNTRGVLCHHCNVGLGHFKDSMTRLEAAIAYLARPPLERLV